MVVFALSLAAQSARAQSAEEQALARELFEEGVQLAQERRWDEAVDAFSRSYALAERAPTLFNLASTLMRAGRLVEARERYRRFAHGTDDEALREEAERAVAEIEPRLGRIRLTMSALSPVDVVRLDAEPLNHAALGAPIPADPGIHTIRITRGETELAVRRVDVGEGQTREIAISLPPPVQDEGPPLTSEEEEEIEEDDSSGIASSPWFWIALGVVVVAGGVTAAVLLVNESQRLPLYEGTTDPPSLGLP